MSELKLEFGRKLCVSSFAPEEGKKNIEPQYTFSIFIIGVEVKLVELNNYVETVLPLLSKASDVCDPGGRQPRVPLDELGHGVVHCLG